MDWDLNNNEVCSSPLKHIIFTFLKISLKATEISNILLTCTQSKGHSITHKVLTAQFRSLLMDVQKTHPVKVLHNLFKLKLCEYIPYKGNCNVKPSWILLCFLSQVKKLDHI